MAFNTSGVATSGVVARDLDYDGSDAHFDRDNNVGASDLLALLANWGSHPPKGDCPADVAGDRSVDSCDLFILLEN